MTDKSSLIQKLLKGERPDADENFENLANFDPEKLDPKQLEALISQVNTIFDIKLTKGSIWNNQLTLMHSYIQAKSKTQVRMKSRILGVSFPNQVSIFA
jgi:hypothetical protein